jgi:hypothetical protein
MPVSTGPGLSEASQGPGNIRGPFPSCLTNPVSECILTPDGNGFEQDREGTLRR